MGTDNIINSRPAGFKVMTGLFIASLALNGYQAFQNSSVSEAGTQAPKSNQEMVYQDSAADCADTIDMRTAQSWIGKAMSLKFNNKSIFICPDVVNAMISNPEFAGIWIRRGKDDVNSVHDIAWMAMQTPGLDPDRAYLLSSRSCVCVPCCGGDTSDFREFQ